MESNMKQMRWTAVLLIICATALASDAPRGTVPHSSPDKYSAHAEQNGVAIGATLLTTAQVRKAFFADVNRCCLVVEVAMYPPKDAVAQISLDDFTLRVVGQDIAAMPSTAKTAALHSSQDRDRVRPMLIAAMEQELSEKGLPQGSTTAPVSGYMYFSLPKVKKAKYELEYTPQGNKTLLPLN
jgi:hypothetical protein